MKVFKISKYLFFLLIIFTSCSRNEQTSSKTLKDKFRNQQPYKLEFGRGSGRYGLDIISLDNSGNLIITKNSNAGWLQTKIQITPKETLSIINLIDTHNLLDMRRKYSREISDGTQWIFWFKTKDTEKSIYYDNNFPKEIKDFALELDKRLKNLEKKFKWVSVPSEDARLHEKKIWLSIKKK